ncbi:MAG: hypothetical protein EPN91_08500 [Salinibacterium sp.]|nr:MAG: hypothetical protein EPN91_08500 [Salinibacterium sp.]
MALLDTNNPPAEVLAANSELMMGEVRKWLNDLACGDLKNTPALLNPLLLGLIALRLGQLVNNKAQGSNYYRISPFQLTKEGQKIVERQQDGLVRTVLLWVDKAGAGPTPYIRVGVNKMNMVAGQQGSGGIQADAGKQHELGNVRPEVELWAASSVDIWTYVIEYA